MSQEEEEPVAVADYPYAPIRIQAQRCPAQLQTTHVLQSSPSNIVLQPVLKLGVLGLLGLHIFIVRDLCRVIRSQRLRIQLSLLLFPRLLLIGRRRADRQKSLHNRRQPRHLEFFFLIRQPFVLLHLPPHRQRRSNIRLQNLLRRPRRHHPRRAAEPLQQLAHGDPALAEPERPIPKFVAAEVGRVREVHRIPQHASAVVQALERVEEQPRARFDAAAVLVGGVVGGGDSSIGRVRDGGVLETDADGVDGRAHVGVLAGWGGGAPALVRVLGGRRPAGHVVVEVVARLLRGGEALDDGAWRGGLGCAGIVCHGCAALGEGGVFGL